MGSKTQQTSTNAYNPASMAAFNTMQPQIQQGWSSLQNQPLSNPYVQAAYTGGMNQAGQQGQNIQANIGQAAAGGFGGMNTPGFLQAQQQAGQRDLSGLQQQAFTNAMGQGAAQEAGILGGMQAYHPLQTGGKEVTQQSGLGTWLPQLIGSLGGAAMNAFAPGLGSIFSGGSSGWSGPGITPTNAFMSGTVDPMGSYGSVPSTMPGGYLQSLSPFSSGAGGSSFTGGEDY